MERNLKYNIFCGVKESGKTNGCDRLPFVFPLVIFYAGYTDTAGDKIILYLY